MTTLLVVLVVVGLMCLAVGALVEAAHRAKRRDVWVRPAAQVLIDNLPKTGLAVDSGVIDGVATTIRDRPEKYVKLPKGFPIDARDLESCVTVCLPVSPGTQEKTRDRIVADIGSRLGFEGLPTADWSYVGHGAVVRLYPTPSFGEPRSVYDYLPHIAALSEPFKVLLGLDLEGKPVSYDHVTMGPHLKASAGSGGGKSNLYRFLVPQYIRKGAQVIILDVKGVSMLDLAVALEFRNIRYFSEAETCHNAFQAVFEELERRRKADINARLAGEKAVFTPLHVIMEEANTLMAMLKDFWEYAKKLHSEAATHSPAIRSMHYSVYMGREFGIYLHVIAQRAEAAVFGGGAVRENFNAALMSKWDMRTWRMLGHGHKYIPHPMDWSWYLVTSTDVVRYLPPMLQDSDAVLIADLENVVELAWPDPIESVPDVRVTALGGGGHQPSIERASVSIELPVTMTLAEVAKFIEAHGYAVPYATLRKWQSGERSPESQGFAKWINPEGDNASGAKVYKRLDVIKWMVSKGAPSGQFWDGHACDIKASDCEVKRHVIYGIYVDGIDGVGYVGQTHQAVETRIDQHKEEQYWGDVITGFVKLFEGEMTCIEARGLEAMLIGEWGPTLNRAIPQIGAKPEPAWNAAGESATVLRNARHERDKAAGKEVFTSPRERVK
jgi:hypothetical protein